jgi:hypothetical protein
MTKTEAIELPPIFDAHMDAPSALLCAADWNRRTKLPHFQMLNNAMDASTNHKQKHTLSLRVCVPACPSAHAREQLMLATTTHHRAPHYCCNAAVPAMRARRC